MLGDAAEVKRGDEAAFIHLVVSNPILKLEQSGVASSSFMSAYPQDYLGRVFQHGRCHLERLP
jgi:hypothetical protein